jgi:WD repeat-containing protein mio
MIAVGLSTGRVDLLRVEATKHARNNVLSSGPSVSLPARNSRSCNALAFCDIDPNYLAVGMDKVRGDPSLVIWDIYSASPALSMPPKSTTMVDEDSLLSARPHPRIPRADVGPRTDSRVLQQHAPTEIVSALRFLPNSTHLLLAGISHRWLRLFDLRSSVPSTTNVASKVHGISTDPFDPHRIACFGDGTVTVWDARRLPQPILTFTEKDAYADGARHRLNSAFTTIEFSSTRRGTLAVLERDSTYVRFWDLQQVQIAEGSPNGERSRESSQSNVITRRSWTNLPWTTSAPAGRESTVEEPRECLSTLVLADTRKSMCLSFTHSGECPLIIYSEKLQPHTCFVRLSSQSSNASLDVQCYGGQQ